MNAPSTMPAHGSLPPSNPRKRPRAALMAADNDVDNAPPPNRNSSSNSHAGTGSALGFALSTLVLSPWQYATGALSKLGNTALSFIGVEPIGAASTATATAPTPAPAATASQPSTPSRYSSAPGGSSSVSVSVSVSRTSQPPTGHNQIQLPARDLHSTPRGFLVPDSGATPRPRMHDFGASAAHHQSDHGGHQMYPSIYDHDDAAADEEPPTKRARIVVDLTDPSNSMPSAKSSALSSSAASFATRQSHTSYAFNLPTSSSSSNLDTAGTQTYDRQSRRTTSSVPDSHMMRLGSGGPSSAMRPPVHSRRSYNPKLNVNVAVQHARDMMSPIPSSLAAASSSSSHHHQPPTSIIDLTLASSTTSSRTRSRASVARSSHSSTAASSSHAATGRSWRSTPSDVALSKLLLSSKFQPLTADQVDLMYRLRHLRDKVHSGVPLEPESEVHARLLKQEEEIEEHMRALAEQAAKDAAPKRSVDLWELTPEMKATVTESLKYALDPANEEVPMADHVTNALIGKDFATLKPKTWLNDEIVNTYGVMLAKRTAESKGALPRVRILQSFFYSRFRDEGYARIKSWTRGKKMMLGKVDLLLFPIHGGAHWTVGCINFKLKRIEYYDSLHGPDGGYFERMRMYLREEARDKLNEEFDFTGWIDYYPRDDIPLQLNSYDCGVFTCAFMEHITRQAELKDAFDQTHLVKWRERVFYELLTKKPLT